MPLTIQLICQQESCFLLLLLSILSNLSASKRTQKINYYDQSLVPNKIRVKQKYLEFLRGII
ncbi:hypothetical protein C7H19_10575 [Aphanothece hegewaldii CCALA 016]|uniref:Uncharacterized protein n=1 Tax=Aphanothece hegewaldii CCALA 016 TaxID=2107694 RepID=A0A2T1LYC9_9CHRO|nr:hypothetical protein C7H19_10575 [Aphanothece hegewaldii CCALA 016]